MENRTLRNSEGLSKDEQIAHLESILSDALSGVSIREGVPPLYMSDCRVDVRLPIPRDLAESPEQVDELCRDLFSDHLTIHSCADVQSYIHLHTEFDPTSRDSRVDEVLRAAVTIQARLNRP